ncbi:hypothetical protein B0T10DRAFT_502182 [Thelonectria olida]|uniref:BTB domain-containing protein n=1 Tax=Thelonectria olida TaxID=1576542 RepID=A0A9P9AHD4_9HYPO|nr:hypothetical protein B0T10DRAFT_502182 [Thelonectria olida]
MVTIISNDNERIEVDASAVEKSNFFQKALSSPWKESQTQTIDFSETEYASAVVLNAYVEWLSTGQITKNRAIWASRVLGAGFADYICDESFGLAYRICASSSNPWPRRKF